MIFTASARVPFADGHRAAQFEDVISAVNAEEARREAMSRILDIATAQFGRPVSRRFHSAQIALEPHTS